LAAREPPYGESTDGQLLQRFRAHRDTEAFEELIRRHGRAVFFPGYEGQGYKLAGFVWYHGWNDGVDPKNAVPEYEQNLVNLIKDVRKDLKSPKLPVVIGELTGPWVQAPGAWATLRKAQANAARRPEFEGNVIFVETHEFVRLPKDSPNPGHGHHEFGNAETYFLVGDALARGMIKLLTAVPK